MELDRVNKQATAPRIIFIDISLQRPRQGAQPNLVPSAWFIRSGTDRAPFDKLKTLDARSPILKIATFNINGVNKRLPNLLAWLAAARPDVLCLQELKAAQEAFPIEQSRYIEAAIGGILIASIYLPNGNPQPGPKFDYKLDWFDRLIDHAAGMMHDDIPAVLAGDFNVVPTDFDIYSMRSWAKDVLTQPAPRAAFGQMIDLGWTDATRALHPDEPMFTVWSYLRNRWPRDAGLRLDHLLLSPALAPRLTAGGVDRDVRGEPDASDHAAAWIELRLGS